MTYMTPQEFHRMALCLPETAESSHMSHPDFRVCNKIFATLGYPDDGQGMVKLTPEQQHAFMRAAPEVFSPCNGAWGRQKTACQWSVPLFGICQQPGAF